MATIGNFDGVHLGHQALVRRARGHAERSGTPWVVAVTFDPHPSAVLRPDSAPPALTTLDERVRLLREAGADDVVVVEFTQQTAAQSPQEFAEFLAQDPRIAPEVIVVGDNFRFGQRASGDPQALAEWGRRLGFGVDAVSLVGSAADSESPWSSTVIREFIAAGDMAAAGAALGRSHRLSGPVVRGDARGRQLGYPTANVEVSPDLAIPPDGVYAGWLTVDGVRYPAAVSIGTNPQFDGRERRVEAYVIDRDDLDLYDRHVDLDLVARLRGQAVFADVDALVQQMGLDVGQARAVLSG